MIQIPTRQTPKFGAVAMSKEKKFNDFIRQLKKVDFDIVDYHIDELSKTLIIPFEQASVGRGENK